MNAPPRIDTARLILDAHVAADFDELLALWTDPAVTALIGGPAAARGDVWSRLLRYRGLWALLGFGYWAVRERDGGRFVGDVGFADFHRAVAPSIDGVPEAGWVLAGWAHGRGYASEAAGAALGWLDGTGLHRRTVCLINPGNAGSLGVAAKLGFVREGMTWLHDHDTVLLSRARG